MVNTKNQGLYIGVVCLIGIIAIFFFDAYIGIYDTLYVEEGWEREIAFDKSYPKYVRADYGETIYFRYEITNRRFNEYNTGIQASVWRGNDKDLTLFSVNKSVKPFDSITVEWTLETEKLEPNTKYILKINTNTFERIVRMEFYQRDKIGIDVSPEIIIPIE